eukprot:PhF_6_TR7827/c0_g1_i5/m.11303
MSWPSHGIHNGSQHLSFAVKLYIYCNQCAVTVPRPPSPPSLTYSLSAKSWTQSSPERVDDHDIHHHQRRARRKEISGPLPSSKRGSWWSGLNPCCRRTLTKARFTKAWRVAHVRPDTFVQSNAWTTKSCAGNVARQAHSMYSPHGGNKVPRPHCCLPLRPAHPELLPGRSDEHPRVRVLASLRDTNRCVFLLE